MYCQKDNKEQNSEWSLKINIRLLLSLLHPSVRHFILHEQVVKSFSTGCITIASELLFSSD